MFRIGKRQKRALMMIEPPGNLGRVGVLEIDDRVLVAVEQSVLPGLHRTMRHSREVKVRVRVKPLPIKTIKQRSRGGAIKAAVVETQADSGHERTVRAFLCDGWDAATRKAFNNAVREKESQALNAVQNEENHRYADTLSKIEVIYLPANPSAIPAATGTR